jgi:hypothetical protein
VPLTGKVLNREFAPAALTLVIREKPEREKGANAVPASPPHAPGGVGVATLLNSPAVSRNVFRTSTTYLPVRSPLARDRRRPPGFIRPALPVLTTPAIWLFEVAAYHALRCPSYFRRGCRANKVR